MSLVSSIKILFCGKLLKLDQPQCVAFFVYVRSDYIKQKLPAMFLRPTKSLFVNKHLSKLVILYGFFVNMYLASESN